MIVLDPDDRRRRRRTRELRAAGFGPWQAADPRAALELARCVRASQLVVARGCSGPELAPLREHCAREGVRLVTAGPRWTATGCRRAARPDPYRPVAAARRYSRLSRAMFPTEIAFGHAASHS